MLALVSVDAKDFIPVLTAHIFTVCPTAVPTLPLLQQEGDDNVAPPSEDALMESLGMLRNKDGEFESFERFLTRTEVRYSLVGGAVFSCAFVGGVLRQHFDTTFVFNMRLLVLSLGSYFASREYHVI